MQVGARPASGGTEIGRFFPLPAATNVTIPARVMRAIKALINP
jgi:hypothetical protein